MHITYKIKAILVRVCCRNMYKEKSIALSFPDIQYRSYSTNFVLVDQLLKFKQIIIFLKVLSDLNVLLCNFFIISRQFNNILYVRILF